MKFKMAATAGLSLTLDPMGEMFQNASSLKPLEQLKSNCPGMIKNIKFVEDHPMYTHMDSLALIIFVVPEKKAFEHFPIGSNVNLCIAVAAILDFRSASGRKSKMATTAGHRLTLDPMGKCSNAFFSGTTNMIKAKPVWL
jgi:hypothetical protein